MPTQVNTGTSALGFHEGATLIRVAGTYPTLLEVILEMVQNAIDSDASLIWVTLNQKMRTLSVRDNGDGVSQQKFEEALQSVGRTIKPKDKLGRFGLGLVAPVGKCDRYTFISTYRNAPRSYIEWSFLTKVIVEQKEVHIPLRTRPDLWFGENYRARGITGVNWRTEARLEKITSDRFVSKVTMESLCEGVSLKYNQSIKRKKTVIVVTFTDDSGNRHSQQIKGKDWDGDPLPEEVISNRDGGQNVFRLYLARRSKKGKTGKVIIGETGNDFRISFPMFTRSLPEGTKLSEETVQALASGIFEGEVLTSRAQFHANRRGFEANDALLGFCVAIENWFQKTGVKHFEEARQTRREERYQDLGIRSMKVIEALTKSSVGQHILRAIEKFKAGTIGSGHYPYSGKILEQPGIAVQHQIGNDSTDTKDVDRKQPITDHKGHHPFVVYGPSGQRRKLIRSDSLGLGLVHEPLKGNKLWELDLTTGTITLNIRHPYWVECEECGDKVLMRFQEYLVIQALSVQILPEDWQEIAVATVDEATGPYVFTLVHGDLLAGRILSRPKKIEVKDKKPRTGTLIMSAKR